MTDELCKAIETMRARYLSEYPHTHKKADRIALFEDIRGIAGAAGALSWEKFAAATLCFLRNDNEAALSLFDEATALDPEWAYPWYGKGNVLDDLKRYEEALAAYEKAIALDSEYTYASNGKGNVLDDLKRYEEALVAYEKAIALDPEFAAPWNGKGNVLAKQKRHEEALTAFEKAIVLDPEFAAPWNGKGNVLCALKRYEEALATYEKAITLDPEDATPWNGKGVVLDDLKRYEEALEAYEKASTQDPEDGRIQYNLGLLHWEQKRPKEALAAYEKATALDPEYADPNYNLGLMHWEQKQPKKALVAFERAATLETEPEWKEAAESWIERARRMIKSKESGESDEEIDRDDRSSVPALITNLFEAMKDDLDVIREKKRVFQDQMAESVSKARIVGVGGADDMLLVLRDWNSFSPILRRDLRDQDGPGPEERLGGGYFLAWKGHGIVVDPGADFVTQLYKKGLSIADMDTVVVTHCHLDHTRDLESLVDLNYRHNEARGFKPDPKKNDFRQLQFKLCSSAAMKYNDYLKATGCCRKSTHLDPAVNPWPISDFIDVEVIPVKHTDITGDDGDAIGLVFVLKDESGTPVKRIGITSDSKWIESLPESFKECDVLVAHLGTIEVGEDKSKREGNEEADGGDFLKTDLRNHLGTKGCFRLLQDAKPKLFVMGEFGEELVETRFKILQVFNKLKPDETEIVLGGDSNLAIKLGEELSVCCSHPECARLWTRIPLNEVHPVLGGDFLFQYICSGHDLREPSGG